MSASTLALVLILGLLALLLLAWLVARLWLTGADMSAYDRTPAERFPGAPESAEARAVLAAVGRLRRSTAQAPATQRLAATRAAWEALFADQPHDAEFRPLATAGIAGEWVLAPGADPRRRTLYLHGGAYAIGSAHSHRPLTVAFSHLTRGAVLALDYRLLPEHPRRAGIADCRNAYRWLLDHGPAAADRATAVFIAGDSAGGNLTLALLPWIRDQRLRAPDGAVALSPQTDSTLASPSWRANLATDPMLGPSYRPFVRMPRALLLWLVWMQNRINPRDPAISPLYGNLAGLPPTLVQVSEAEMLRDDGVRYVGRARAAGSPAELQSWPGMVHVWQLFNPQLPEARQALAQIGKFLATAESGGATPDGAATGHASRA